MPEYAEVIKRFSSTVEDVSLLLAIPPAPGGNLITAKVRGYDTDSLSIMGTTPNSIDLTPRGFDQGRYFTDEENNRGAKVAVLGYDIAHTLFPDGNAVNRTFSMDGTEYTVVGVVEKAKGGFLGENGQDTEVDIPLKTAVSLYPQVNAWMLTCKAKPGMRKDAYDDVEAIMRRTRHLSKDQEDDFSRKPGSGNGAVR